MLVAGIGLVIYDWAWNMATRLVGLLTDAILGLPWVADGVRRMLQSLLIGGATGSAVAAEFVVPLIVLAAGGALLALLLVRVGLDVAGALIYVSGGLALGLSVTTFGRRLLTGWLIAAAAIVILPVLWSIVFATGAALMLDAGSSSGHGGLGTFVTQLYNVAAALTVFAIAIKLASAVFRHATNAITTVAATPITAGRGAGGATAPGGAQRLAQNATPAGLARFSQHVRGGISRGAVAGARAALLAVRNPAAAAGAAGGTVRSTQQAAGRLRDTMASSQPGAAPPTGGRWSAARAPGPGGAIGRAPPHPTTGARGAARSRMLKPAILTRDAANRRPADGRAPVATGRRLAAVASGAAGSTAGLEPTGRASVALAGRAPDPSAPDGSAGSGVVARASSQEA